MLKMDNFKVGPRQADLELIGNNSIFDLSVTIQPIDIGAEIWASIHDADGSPISKVIPTRKFSNPRQAHVYAITLANEAVETLSEMSPKLVNLNSAVII